MFYFETNELKFTAEFLGRVRLVGSVASLVGVGCYNFCLKVREQMPGVPCNSWHSMLRCTNGRARDPSGTAVTSVWCTHPFVIGCLDMLRRMCHCGGCSRGPPSSAQRWA